MRRSLALLVVAVCVGCQSTGTTTTPISTQAAQNVGQDQGTAQATESGSAINHLRPVIVNALAAKTVEITMVNGEPKITITASEDSEVKVQGAYFGNVRFNDENAHAEVSSGGGSAGGTGGAVRTDSGIRASTTGVDAAGTGGVR